ncbi:hypothetical protein ACIHFE_06190 [Streptomyces sp. NPDC052396]|uniref:hypothetical protein n=1 Tax=Streptomyces sp. NPDC052396 TaxID=3365689 RepID=UPI0037CF3024
MSTQDAPSPELRDSRSGREELHELSRGEEKRANQDAEEGPVADYDPHISVEQRFGRNDGVAIGIQIAQEIHRLRGDLLNPDWITQRLATYERSVEERAALTGILSRENVLVLHGPEGAGRYTAALDALHQKVGTHIRQVRREPGEPFNGAEGLQGKDTGWILDLRDEGDRRHSGIGPALAEDASHLQRSGSYLAVLISTEAWERAAKGTTDLDYELPFPDSKRVLRAHLEKVTPPVEAARWLNAKKITDGIDDLVPAAVVEWAHIIREAERLEEETGQSFEELVNHVVEAAEDWRTRLLEWHNNHCDSAHRNYLLAASVLDGATAETVYAAADVLARALGETPAPHTGQQGLGVIALTDAIEADLTEEDTIAFRRPRFAAAVVDYFWADRPHLIKDFTRWTAAQTNNKDLPDEITDQLADRVIGWALDYMDRKRTTKLLREIAEQWAESLPEQASDLLTAAVLDPGTSRRACAAYLTWARRSDEEVPPRLKVALAQACERLAAAYPTMMLLRLTELAAHTESEEVLGTVGQALTVLWDLPKQRQAIQDRLKEWAAGTQEGRRTAAHHAFVHLAARTAEGGRPVLLTAAHEDAHWAWHAARWRGLLDNSVPFQKPLGKALNVWMDAAVAHSDLREQILTIFQHAVYQPQTDPVYVAERFLALNRLLYSWAPVQSSQPPTDQGYLRDQLILALHRADPAAPMSEPHAPVG